MCYFMAWYDDHAVSCAIPALTLPPSSVLDAYREAVVERVMAPDFSVELPVEGES